ESVVAKGQVVRRGLDHGCRARAPLADHGHRGLDGHHGAVRRFIRAGAGADVHDALDAIQRLRDRRGQARIGTATLLIADPDLVVELRHPRRGARSVDASADQARVNMGTGGPPSVGLKTTFTRWPMRMASRSQSTMFVIIVTPSSSVT